jgi:hypothetical protein
MKNALIISNNKWRYDYRLHQIYQTLKFDYNVHLLTSDKINNIDSKGKLTNFSIFKFKKIDLVFSAGALLKSLMALYIYKDALTIYYVREIIGIKENKSIKLKLYFLLEQHVCRKSNLVLTGNSFRSEYIFNTYRLDKFPTIWENIRRLNGAQLNDEILFNLNKKYRHLDEFKIILFTSGYSIWRETDKLIESKRFLPDEYAYLIVGGGMMSDNPENDYKLIKKKINDFSLKNVFFEDRVEEHELLYLIKKSYIGVVHYNNEDINNLYCSSGKIHEFLSEGIPIVTTTNPPLVVLTEENGVGISTNFINEGILEIHNNYNTYKRNINIYLKNNNMTINNLKLKNKIHDTIKEISEKV